MMMMMMMMIRVQVTMMTDVVVLYSVQFIKNVAVFGYCTTTVRPCRTSSSVRETRCARTLAVDTGSMQYGVCGGATMRAPPR